MYGVETIISFDVPYFAFLVSMKAWDEIELQRVVNESF